MDVSSLWHSTPRNWIVAKLIAVDHRDRLVEIREHPSRQQSGHARTENHHVLSDFRHHESPIRA